MNKQPVFILNPWMQVVDVNRAQCHAAAVPGGRQSQLQLSEEEVAAEFDSGIPLISDRGGIALV